LTVSSGRSRAKPMLRKVGLRRTPMKRRPRPSDVPDWLPGYLRARDRGCVPARLGAPDPCQGRLTIEHVRDRDKASVGKRAPSDKWHTLMACLGHNTGWCLTSAAKELEREYLLRVEGEADAA
jgi:hypothetical protein